MYATQARLFIRKLIRLQQVIEDKGYRRADQPAIRQSRNQLKTYLDYFRYETDEKMRGFWQRNQNHIRTLLPSDSHPAFQKLMQEYLELDLLIQGHE
jgi:hypothetical protein